MYVPVSGAYMYSPCPPWKENPVYCDVSQPAKSPSLHIPAVSSAPTNPDKCTGIQSTSVV